MDILLEGEEAKCWEMLSDLRDMEGIDFYIPEAPSPGQNNNELTDIVAAGTSTVTVGVIILKLGPQAISAMRDIAVKYLEGRQVKIKVKDGKNEVTYEGTLDGKQREQLQDSLQQISKQLEP